MNGCFVANWKMHGSEAFAREWAAEITPPPPGCTVAVCPPLPYLTVLRAALPPAICLGAQTVAASAADGAHTGEVSARMLADCGCEVVIIGHSERRAQQGENDALCAAKIQAAVASGLRPILCVGESAEVRAGGGSAAATAAVLAQLEATLATADEAVWQNLIIAYEPIWAIGSGQTPSAEDISHLHAAIYRHIIRQMAGLGGKITLLYGGSVNADNAARLIGIDHVDGFLVGGASLKPQQFNAICHSVQTL